MAGRWRFRLWVWGGATLAGLIFALGFAGGIFCDVCNAPPAEDAIIRAEAGNDLLVTITSRPGVTQDFFLVKPPNESPVASVILFAGGEGNLDLAAQSDGWIGESFVLRSRFQFAAEGFLVAVVDTPSDRRHGYSSFRVTDQHAADIAAIIAYLREQAPVPVWLVGTSRGSISAANVALLRTGGPDGLVLSSATTRGSKLRPVSIMDLPLGDIRLPTLLVHHRDDACPNAPYGDLTELERRLKNVSVLDAITLAGGASVGSEPCSGFSHHGYFGVEREVVTSIAAWIKAAGPKS
jgi:pimeloyl-ACP methyl ester carboxylesterase